MIQVSVIICCYNGKSRLRSTIEHLLAQRTRVKWELVFVDNASTDGSAEFVRILWNEKFSNAELHIVREENPGLIYARKCGVRASRGKYIVFCDDDNWLREDYIQIAYDTMEKMPNVGVLGGRSTLAPGLHAPSWWKEHQGNYAVGNQLPHSGLANDRGFLYGAGMVTRSDLARMIFDDRYPFLKTGRKGDQCLSGEDGEYCVRVRMMGYDLYYEEELFYWHDILPSRLTLEQLHKLIRSFQEGASIDHKYDYALKYSRHGVWSRITWLFVRYWKYCRSSEQNKGRRKELFYTHAYLMGLFRTSDKELDVIKGFMRMASKVANGKKSIFTT